MLLMTRKTHGVHTIGGGIWRTRYRGYMTTTACAMDPAGKPGLADLEPVYPGQHHLLMAWLDNRITRCTMSSLPRFL